MAFTSSIAALTPPTTVAQFKTALDTDLATLESYAALGFTSQVLALPAIHSPTQFKNALVADLAAIDTTMSLTSIGLDGREKWGELLYQLALWVQDVDSNTITLVNSSGGSFPSILVAVNGAGTPVKISKIALNQYGDPYTLN